MISANSAVNFNSVDMMWINGYARYTGSNPDDLVREWTLQRLEDEMDASDLIDVMIDENGMLSPLPEL